MMQVIAVVLYFLYFGSSSNAIVVHELALWVLPVTTQWHCMHGERRRVVVMGNSRDTFVHTYRPTGPVDASVWD